MDVTHDNPQQATMPVTVSASDREDVVETSNTLRTRHQQGMRLAE